LEKTTPKKKQKDSENKMDKNRQQDEEKDRQKPSSGTFALYGFSCDVYNSPHIYDINQRFREIKQKIYEKKLVSLDKFIYLCKVKS